MPKYDRFRSTRYKIVILGLVPRIGGGTVLVPILGTSPRMTIEADRRLVKWWASR
jgi:hypothetical protein